MSSPVTAVPTITVEYKGLSVKAQALYGASKGALTLLLGPPKSGKSTFLKLLGGHLKPTRTLKVEGSIKYNGQTPSEFELLSTAGFVDQVDLHNPNLTVLETLQFAFQTLCGVTAKFTKKDAQQEAASAAEVQTANAGAILHRVWEHPDKVDVIMRLMGLYHCKDTLVGDPSGMVRGISGGERKRLSVAEALVGPRRLLLLDEMSTGLDSATLYSVMQFFSQVTHDLKLTVVASLLQPPPEVFAIFDDVILLTDGHVLYHGPTAEVTDFFAGIGFEHPERKDLPSFLLEVTTPAGQAAFATSVLPSNPTKQQPAPGLLMSLDEMAAAFWTGSKHGRALVEQLEKRPFDRNSAHPQALAHHKFALSVMQNVLLVTARHMKLTLRDTILLRGRLGQVIVMGFISGSLFYQLQVGLQDLGAIFGICFIATLFIAFGSLPQLNIVMVDKNVFFKHRNLRMLPAYAQAWAMSMSQLPLSIMDATVFGIILYFLVGFYVSPGYFFIWFLLLAACSGAVSGVFRLIGCVAPNLVVGNAIGGMMLLLLIVTAGFALVRTDIPPWLIWAYWISPMAYTFRGLVINELTSPPWQKPTPQNPDITYGDAALRSFTIYTDRFWIWVSVGYLIGLFIILTVLSGLALHYLSGSRLANRVPDEAELEAMRKRTQERRAVLLNKQKTAGLNGHRAKDSPEGGSWSTAVPPASGLDKDVGRGAVRSGYSVASNTYGTPSETSKSNGSGSITGIATETLTPVTVAAANTSSSGDSVVLVDSMASSLPFTPITLAFLDIHYFVPNPSYSSRAAAAQAKVRAATADHDLPTATKGALSPPKNATSNGPNPAAKELEILKGVTGYCEPGRLLALMGGSGAGKTTLMDVLLGRKTIGRTTGEIYVNGHPKQQNTWARVCGYVEQFDIHTAAQTVIEALWFSARLRLPSSISDQQVRWYVEEVMDIVDLVDIQNSIVGSSDTGGLSVEQRKRMTIAVELVANPSVIFMDEPTSGLDARAAAVVMKAVRNVARNGRSVMVTIHQPTIEIFESFDDLVLLQRGGRVTYFGPLGLHSSELIRYLESCGAPPCEAGFNPATWMLEVTGGSMAVRVKTVADADFPQLYLESPLATGTRQRAEELVKLGAANNGPLQLSSRYAATNRVQARELVNKWWRFYLRTPSYTMGRVAMAAVVGAIYAVTFLHRGHLPVPAQFKDVQNLMGTIFSAVNFLGMSNLIQAMPVVAMERVVFYRERGSAMYEPLLYAVSLALVEVPWWLGQTFTFIPIMYFGVGFAKTAGHFFYFILMFFENLSFYTIFGQTLVYLTPSPLVAQVIGGALNFLFNLFNGFVITQPRIARGWEWMNRITPTTWVLYGLGTNQLGGNHGPMLLQDLRTRTTVSAFVHDYFGYQQRLSYWCLLIVAAYVIFFRILSVWALKYCNFYRR